MWSKQGVTKRNARAGLLLAHPYREHARAFVVHVEQPTRLHPVLQGISRSEDGPKLEQGRQEQERPRSWAGSMPATPRRCRKCASRSSNTACSSWGSNRRYGAKACNS